MGRTALFMIIVFNMTFMFMGFQLSAAASSAYEKYCAYGDIEQAGLALESAANIAINNALMCAPCSVDTFLATNATFGKATFSIEMRPVFTSAGARDGDSVVVTATYPLTGSVISSLTCTTSVRVKGNSFSQYVFYSNSEKDGSGNAINWTGGDTVRGRYHTQDNITTNGKAVFQGKVTMKGSINSSGTAPVFYQTPTHADVSIPQSFTDLNTLANNGGRIVNALNTYIQFNVDGTVTVRTGALGWTETSTSMNAFPNATIPKCTTYASITALAASGVFLVKSAELHVKGTLSAPLGSFANITLGCIDTVTGGTASKVFIDDNLTYQYPPPTSRNPSPSPHAANTMLGIVATNNILVSQYQNHSGSTALKNVSINASIFSQKGGFGAENYSTRSNDGKLTVVGGIQQATRQPVGTGSGSSMTGFLKDYDYDQNLNGQSPNGYPKTPFVVTDWIDNMNIPLSFYY